LFTRPPRTLAASVVVASLVFVLTPTYSALSAPAQHASSRVALQLGAALLVEPAAARPVTPHVREVLVSATKTQTRKVTLSEPERAAGFAVVGATWTGAAPAGLQLSVRTRDGSRWSSWTPLGIDLAEHGPDGGTVEGRTDRQGTEPVVVGNVDFVQLRATSRTGATPRGLRLSVVNPGLSLADDDPVSTERVVAPAGVSRLGQAPRPRIRTRAAWGANERLRTRRPTFGVVRAGFVHHTVNTNGYSPAAVPAIIRGIYAFHTQSRGWSDIGYNFLVDRFGRIWEGRFGGVVRNVIGAHTLSYNHLAFAMSAIGNFQTRKPPGPMVSAFGRLMAWKLGINGVAAGSTRQRLNGRFLKAINGHRDVGATACPGIHLYNRLPTIRRIAVSVQSGPAPAPPAPPAPPSPPPEDGGPGPGAPPQQ
jgi:hypothetical protein